MANDFRKYYDLETYLFNEVTAHFKENGYIDAFDFFCIIIWKANRAKTKIAKRLIELNKGTLDETAKYLSISLSKTKGKKERLSLLINDFGFLLPMASAILSVLYPEEFTIYDTRVCDCLGKYHELSNISDFEKLWIGYTQYIQDVKLETPIELSLRDKDRFLWGKSFYRQLLKDIESSFGIN